MNQVVIYCFAISFGSFSCISDVGTLQLIVHQKRLLKFLKTSGKYQMQSIQRPKCCIQDEILYTTLKRSREVVRMHTQLLVCLSLTCSHHQLLSLWKQDLVYQRSCFHSFQVYIYTYEYDWQDFRKGLAIPTYLPTCIYNCYYFDCKAKESFWDRGEF